MSFKHISFILACMLCILVTSALPQFVPPVHVQPPIYPPALLHPQFINGRPVHFSNGFPDPTGRTSLVQSRGVDLPFKNHRDVSDTNIAFFQNDAWAPTVHLARWVVVGVSLWLGFM